MIILFPPDITDEKDTEDQESFPPHQPSPSQPFLFSCSSISLSLLRTKLITHPLFCNPEINAEACYAFSSTVAETREASPQGSFTVGHTGLSFMGGRFNFERQLHCGQHISGRT